jgi:hypothetical protein
MSKSILQLYNQFRSETKHALRQTPINNLPE